MKIKESKTNMVDNFLFNCCIQNGIITSSRTETNGRLRDVIVKCKFHRPSVDPPRRGDGKKEPPRHILYLYGTLLI